MSDQGKSNFQALGAGLLGFVAVLAVGGGAVMLHNSGQTQTAVKPAGAPIDLTSSVPDMPASSSRAQGENRAQSPAPLIGETGDEPSYEASSAAAATPQSASSSSARQRASSRLQVTNHLDAGAASSSAKAVVQNSIKDEEEKPAPAPAAMKAASRLEPVDSPAAIASVHYGVTSRNELMGRAAGPVYNIKGGKGVSGNTAGAGKMADDVQGRIADIRRQLESSNLPADQREKLLKDLARIDANSATSKSAQ